MTDDTPDQAAIFAAVSFEAMPPLPLAEPAPPASASVWWSISTISSISDASASTRGSAVSTTGGVGQQDQQVGIDEVGDQRGDAVVVAPADLVVGDGVVLVDDRHDTQLEQTPQGLPGVQVLGPHDEVERDQQHLAGDEAMGGEGLAVDVHQRELTDGRHRLQRDRVAPAPIAAETDLGESGRDRARGDDDDPVAFGPGRGDVGTELLDRGALDHPVVVGDRRRPDLDDDRAGLGHQSSSYSKAKSPMRTSSPGFTPARASAVLTPSCLRRCWA